MTIDRSGYLTGVCQFGLENSQRPDTLACYPRGPPSFDFFMALFASTPFFSGTKFGGGGKEFYKSCATIQYFSRQITAIVNALD